MVFFHFFVLVFHFKYLLTDLSFKNASTKVFVCQDKRDSQKDVKSNNRKLGKPQNSHTKIGCFYLSQVELLSDLIAYQLCDICLPL